MHYVSSRGKAPELSFNQVLLTGLASDGGLYMPKVWPSFDVSEISSWHKLPYPELAIRVMKPFIGGFCSDAVFKKLVYKAYEPFNNFDVAPLKSLGQNTWALELFHGPTMAFKDIALQLLGQMFDHALCENQRSIAIVGATSGDTGSAAIEACRDKAPIDIFMLHPHNRISEIQRRQMTSVLSPNVHNIALGGTFDDCQTLVKKIFNDTSFNKRWALCAVNSINWARIMAQIVYYFWASLKLGGPKAPITFTVPTGNFGNIFAGYAAYKMGLPIHQLIIASNDNDILTRFLKTGTMKISSVLSTISPSMDIQISSNFERLIFEMAGRDGKFVAKKMTDLRKNDKFTLNSNMLSNIRKLFSATSINDNQTKNTITEAFARSGYCLDPHSAVGLAAARKVGVESDIPTVILATAHPAKFPDAVKAATNVHPNLPPKFSKLLGAEERVTILDNNFTVVKDHIDSILKKKRLQ